MGQVRGLFYTSEYVRSEDTYYIVCLGNSKQRRVAFRKATKLFSPHKVKQGVY